MKKALLVLALALFCVTFPTQMNADSADSIVVTKDKADPIH